MTPGARFDELLQTARADESILRLILYGSASSRHVRIRGPSLPLLRGTIEGTT